MTTSNPSPIPSPQAGGALMATSPEATWKALAALVGRLIFAGVFILAATFKFAGMGATAGYIAAAGFPLAALPRIGARRSSRCS